ncbi:type IX secretion system outer membrane channel protein PorV [Crocinitomix sp.]|nr:type IX secretion system outer membrane channel protein PorV [Crocinitomix sp.]
MKFFFIFFILITFSRFSWTQSSGTYLPPWNGQLNTITTAVPFLRIPINARASGMGDAGIASFSDANGVQWNTAKLSFSDKKAEFSGAISNWVPLFERFNLTELSGYTIIGDKHVIGAAMRYFSLGTHTITSGPGTTIQEVEGKEFALTGGYAFKISERHAVGMNVKYIYSNFTSLFSSNTTPINRGEAMAVELSYSFANKELLIAGKPATFSLGTAISNLGNKITYTDESNRDFLPTNLGIGTGLKVDFNHKHSLLGTVDFNKLLVPTLPLRNNDGEIISGKDNNVGVSVGILQSFYDAPGIVTIGNSGQAIIEKGSRLKEELNEITIGGGFEYVFMDLVALRTGYFYEHRSKGNRKYVTLGAGFFYKYVGFDFSYLVALHRTNPLNRTLRFSLNIQLPNKSK